MNVRNPDGAAAPAPAAEPSNDDGAENDSWPPNEAGAEIGNDCCSSVLYQFIGKHLVYRIKNQMN